jgi:hypothetical protein
MHIHTKVTLLIILFLALTIVAPVAAQEGGDDELSPCGGENVSGTVVAVDEETGVVTIDTGDGLCTVTLDGEYDHPIVTLLGSFFGDVSAETLETALETTQGCAVYDPDSDAWTWADCDAEGAVAVTVIAENEDGTFTFTATVEGEEVTGTVTVEDLATAERLKEALQTLAVEWELDEDGAVVQPGDEIAAYHEAGLGFGVLVKLYAMAAASQEACGDPDETCGVTVEELVEAFLSGTGVGELFREYGRPFVLGIGHVRNGDRGRPAHTDQPDYVHPSNYVRPSGDTDKPDRAGPKPKSSDPGGKPDHAGPKPKSSDPGGKPDHAGPKPKSKGK